MPNFRPPIKWTATVLFLLTIWHAIAADPSPTPPARLTAAEASADARELASLLESTHPDPYTRGGGKLAFARRLSDILAAIPPDGLASADFFNLLRPFVAVLKDGHTQLSSAPSIDKGKTEAPPPRPWLDLEAVDGRLTISRVYRSEDQPLLGAVLTGIEGVSTADLLTRVNLLDGNDNLYQSLADLTWLLRVPADLANLLQRPARELAASDLHFQLQLPNGDLTTAAIPYQPRASTAPLSSPSAFTTRLPKLNAAKLSTGFLTDDGSVACLRLTSMMHYREAFEVWQTTGFMSNLDDHLTQTAAQASEVQPATLQTESVEARIRRVPSAGEEFVSFCEELNRRKTQTLIVDLRGNEGGNSLVADILTACLYGTGAVVRADGGYQIARLSPLYFSTHNGDSLADFRKRTANPALELGDYDFSEEKRWRQRQKNGWTASEIDQAQANFNQQAAQSPTFSRLLAGPLRSGQPLWRGRVLVVTDSHTYSAGFDLVAALLRQGAKVVGVPPAQAGNCFIDICPAELTHSRLQVTISFKASYLFPDEPAKGDILHPDRELTYDQLRTWNFDPEAPLRLALEEATAAPPSPAPTP